MITEARILRRLVTVHQNDLRQRIVRRGDSWQVHGREITSYMEDFAEIIDRHELDELLNAKPLPVVIDLMSSTDAIASVFSDLSQEEKIGIAVGLGDERNVFQKKRDEFLGITQIVGDLMDSKTWGKIKAQLSGRKADLVLESALQGLNYIPRDAEFYGLMLNRAWSLLSDQNGTLLAEVPSSLALANAGVNMPAFRRKLGESGVSYKYHNDFSGGFLRLTRTPSSPARLLV